MANPIFARHGSEVRDNSGEIVRDNEGRSILVDWISAWCAIYARALKLGKNNLPSIYHFVKTVWEHRNQLMDYEFVRKTESCGPDLAIQIRNKFIQHLNSHYGEALEKEHDDRNFLTSGRVPQTDPETGEVLRGQVKREFLKTVIDPKTGESKEEVVAVVLENQILDRPAKAGDYEFDVRVARIALAAKFRERFPGLKSIKDLRWCDPESFEGAGGRRKAEKAVRERHSAQSLMLRQQSDQLVKLQKLIDGNAPEATIKNALDVISDPARGAKKGAAVETVSSRTMSMQDYMKMFAASSVRTAPADNPAKPANENVQAPEAEAPIAL